MIESKENNLVKHINKLKHKKDRLMHKQYIIEGEKNVNEALQFDKNNIFKIVVSESYAKKNNITLDFEIFTDEIFEYITEHQTPEGILAIMNMKEKDMLKPDYNLPYIIVLNEIQDPGNLGNIIRIADSLDLKQIILSKNTVDPYMPKVVRSTMGSIFRINTFEMNNEDIIKELKENDYEIYSAVLKKEAENLYNINLKNKKIAVVFGNEANGINNEIINKTKQLYVPMKGKVDSLNVASSVAIISYEIYRQKEI